MKDKEFVNHPEHYNAGKKECWDWMKDGMSDEAFEGFLLGSVLKYLNRYKHKNGVEDLNKAINYIEKMKEIIEICDE